MFSLSGYDFDAHLHMFQWGGRQILLDVNSGSVHLMDEAAARMIELLTASGGDWESALALLEREFTPSEIEELCQDVRELQAAGQIFSEPDDFLFDASSLVPKALCLNVAHACNMRCGYCFAGQGAFGHAPALMDLATGKQALDFIVAASSGRRHLEVDFFGGEPLLVRPLLHELVDYARRLEWEHDKRFNFTLTTNGLLIDEELIEFVKNQDIAMIMSLDGRPEVHDRNRPMPDGSGSYDRVLPGIKAMVAAEPVSYYVRGTFSRQNLDFASDLQWLIDQGFDNLSLEPAVGTDSVYAIQAGDLPAVLKEYERLTELLDAARAAGRELHFFHYDLDLQGGPCLAKRLSGCGAGLEYLAVTPEGEIYPCHRLIGDPDFLLGHVGQPGLKEEVRQLFARSQLPAKTDCLQCWARFFCGGGCYASAYARNGKLASPDPVSCAMHRKRIECALYLEVKDKAS